MSSNIKRAYLGYQILYPSRKEDHPSHPRLHHDGHIVRQHVPHPQRSGLQTHGPPVNRFNIRFIQ